MPKRIGPTFPAELAAASLTGLPFSFHDDGTLLFGDAVTEVQRRAVLAVYDAHDPAAKPPAKFFARDLLAQLVPDDYAAIQAAIAESSPLGLLWASLLAQGDAPVSTGSARFQQGWTALSQVLGTERAAAIAASLGLA